MKQKTAVGGLLFVVLFLSACQQQEFLFNPFQGTAALEMAFLENAPSAQIYASPDGEEFEILLKLQNEGAFDIQRGFLTLGVEQDYLSIKKWDLEGTEIVLMGPQQASFLLEGKSKLNPFGSDAMVALRAVATLKEPQVETLATQILATACYEYFTQANTPICIDTDVYNRKGTEKVCEISDVSIGGTGSPIVIDSVGVEMLPDGGEFVRPRFTIHISNAGIGQVIAPEAVQEACSAKGLSHDLLNTIKIEEISFSGYSYSKGQMQCNPQKAKLEQGEASVTCTLAPALLQSNKPTYTTNLYIKLKFGYLQSISTETRLEKI
ncbi:hypothetical protein HYS48_01535 [Candidatus Woesearchaeota archaeon]|nr:hypothetical protein [Candidatus Woesearchaeota archaeon]